ncbi:MAG: CoA transferase [Hyphomicrobiales bacterium]|nr:CoA transferase [Hyphomicrobiales bacterium]
MADLDGVLVVALEQAVAAPFASSRLADAGARVIKIERPEGDFAREYDHLVKGESAYFVWLNRGKESIRLDLKRKEDLALVEAMAEKADVFIQNLAPSAAARLGLGAETLTERFPRLIYCSISGYGEDGPYRDHKAYDLLIQGESGLLAINGTPAESTRVGISVCDIAAGETAFGAILRALYARERTGKGRVIEVSLFHTLADWINVPYLQARYGAKPPERVGLKHPTIAPYGAFACADSKAVILSIQNEREWVRLCGEVLGDGGIATDPRFASNRARVANRLALDAIVAGALARYTRAEAMERLDAAGIAYGALNELDDLIVHPQRQTITVATPHGEVELLSPGARIAGEPVTTVRPVPALGQHDEALRLEFGSNVGNAADQLPSPRIQRRDAS